MKKAKLFLLLFSCFAIEFQAQDLTTDSLALVSIYNACDGPNWNAENWLSGPLAD